MGEGLRNDLILLAITLVLGAIAWFIRGIAEDVKRLIVDITAKATVEQHNELAKSLRTEHNLLVTQVAVIADRLERK